MLQRGVALLLKARMTVSIHLYGKPRYETEDLHEHRRSAIIEEFLSHSTNAQQLRSEQSPSAHIQDHWSPIVLDIHSTIARSSSNFGVPYTYIYT